MRERSDFSMPIDQRRPSVEPYHDSVQNRMILPADLRNSPEIDREINNPAADREIPAGYPSLAQIFEANPAARDTFYSDPDPAPPSFDPSGGESGGGGASASWDAPSDSGSSDFSSPSSDN